MRKKKIAILGAGITGLVSAYYLSKHFQVILIEKEKLIGGAASSFFYKDFILDYGPHKIYTELPGIIPEIEKLVPLFKVKKRNSIFLKGSLFDFPLKLSQIALKMPFTALNSFAEILTKPFSRLPDDSYENFLINRFGRTLYNLSFKDYAFKIWGSSPKELDRLLAERRVAVSGILELVKSIVFKDTKKISVDYFYYPEKGINQLLRSLEKKIIENGGEIITNTQVSEIRILNKKVQSIKFDEKTINPDYVISTIPLDSLVDITCPNKDLLNYSKRITYQRLNIIYFILNKPRAMKDCWVFFPEARFLFQRVSEQKAFSQFTSPTDKTAIMVETTKEIDKELITEIIRQLESTKILRKQEINDFFIKTIEKAYPVYKKGFLHELKEIESFFDSIENFYLLGRQGLFNYNNMDQCWDMAFKVSKQIKNNANKEDWQKAKKYFESYRIVD